MWKQANLGNGNANQRHAYGKHMWTKRLRSLSIILLLLISTSIAFIKVGWTQSTLTINVEPTYIGGKINDLLDIQLRVYGANYDDNTAVHTWQVFLNWTASVLELNTTIMWGDFLDGPRIGSWGLLTANADAGDTYVDVVDGSKYQSGYALVIKNSTHQETNAVTDALGNRVYLQTALVNSYTVAAGGGCYPDPSTTVSASVSNPNGRILFGIATQGPAPGATGDGWLATLRFVVQQNANTPLRIDGENTFIINTIGEVLGDEPDELNKGNGYFLSVQPGDAQPDGLIDVFDVFKLGKDWQKCPRVTRNPTTGTGDWTNPTYAFMTDDLRASSNTNNHEAVYGSFGFLTTLWTGVSKVEVGVERRAQSTSSDDSLVVEISNNNGGNWYGAKTEVVDWLSDRFVWLDFTAAVAWTPTGVSNIAVRITFDRGDTTTHYIYVDWITVRVTPSPATLYGNYADANADGKVNAPDLTIQAASYGLDYRP